MELGEVRAWRFSIIAMVVVDIMGIWYWLGLKRSAMAIFFVLMGVLTLAIIAERRLDDEMAEQIKNDPMIFNDKEVKMDKKEEIEKLEKELKKLKEPAEEKKPIEKKEEPKEESTGFQVPTAESMGLPSSEEYNKNMEDAFGTTGL